MAIEQVNELLHHHQHQNQPFFFDALYCEEEETDWGEVDDGEHEGTDYKSRSSPPPPPPPPPPPLPLFPLSLVEHDLFWEDEELISLFAKEKETHCASYHIETNPCLCEARGDAVSWMLKVNAHYGFSALTAILAINYLDRFLSGLHFQQEKPWMIQLAAVTCLSLAAKVEETHVPLLLDFQVEDANYVFEAQTIQKMELLVLSTLNWRMNPVNPLSFLDHIIRRLGLKNNLHWEFLRRCESLVLSSVAADSRFVRYPPSVLAAATMLHVIRQVEPCNAVDYQNQLLDVLKINKDKVNACYGLIAELSQNTSHNKRKMNPQDSMDSLFCFDSSNDSWVLDPSDSILSEPLFKKSRVHEQSMRLPSSLSCRVTTTL